MKRTTGWVAASAAAIALIAVMICGSMPAAADDIVRSIAVSGQQRLDEASVRQHVGLRPGDRCEPARLNAAIKAAFATGFYSDVNLACHDGRLAIVVAENPVISRITFAGRAALEEKALSAAVQLKTRDVFTRARGEAAAERIRDLYRERGYADASVAVETKSVRDGGVELTFRITEASLTKVVHIGFTGNKAFTEAQLRDVITTREAGWFDFLRPVTAPVPDRLAYDRSLIERHYKKHGFTDVEVGEARAEREAVVANGGGNGWRIIFPIDEGQRYAVGDITVKSAIEGVPIERVRQRADLKNGDVVNVERLEKSIDRMTAALIDMGHPSAEVRAFPRRDPKTRTVGIEFEIREGTPLIIDRIEITGNRNTRDFVIRRELNFAEGSVFHALLADIARKRLMKLGLFKSVDIKRSEVQGQAKDRVTVTVAVVEVDSREVGFGIGYSEREGIMGDITLGERNLFGRGQEVKLKLAASELSTEARLSFTEPRLFGSQIAGGFDLFYRDSDLTSTSSYKSTRYGGSVRVGTEVAPDTTSTINYTLARSTMYDVGAGASQAVKLAIPNYPTATSASYLTSSVGNTLTYDTRDSRSNPMQGVFVTSGQEVAGLGGDVRYLRTTGEARAYIPVTEQINLVTRASGGMITGWGGSEVRLLDNFYRGGDLVRGFAVSGIGPRDVLSTAQDALGGTTYAAASAELRFALPGITESSGLRAAVFADAGTLFGTSNTAKSLPGVVGTTASLRASVGAGLVWDSPIGPLQAGYALPVAKQAFDKTQNIYFGLGSGL